MAYIIVGLGNPGEEYEMTRHNAGRMAVERFVKENGGSDWKEDMKLKSLVSEGKVGKEKFLAVLPNTFMNNSGNAVRFLVKTQKEAEKLIVVHDDLDLPLGTMKFSWNRGVGGHKGAQSVVKSVKTEAFLRLRIGVTPATAGGKLKKPKGEQEVLDFIIGKFKKPEAEIMKKTEKRASEALARVLSDGREIAMGEFNR